MNAIAALELSNPVLVYFANVAVASVVVCGAALLMVRGWRSAPLPLRHAVLVSGLAVSVVGPLLLGAMAASGVSLIRIPLGSEVTPPISFDLIPVGPDHRLSELSAVVPAPVAEHEDSAPTPAAANQPVAVVAPEDVPEHAPVTRRNRSWSDVGILLVVVWSAGCVVSLGQFAAGLVGLRQLHRHLRPVRDVRVCESAGRAARSLGLAITPAVFESDLVGAPLSLGLVNAKVVVPTQALARLSNDQLRGLMMHELAHIARRDHLVGLVQRLSVAVYWWNPLVRRVSAAISAVREQICDDLATGGDASADGYAAMLVELAGRTVGRRPLPAAIGMFDGSRREFSRRVERLLDDDRSTATKLDRRMKVFSAAIAIALLLLTGATSIQMQSAAAEPEESGQPTVAAHEIPAETKTETPAVKWPAVLRGVIRDEEGKPVAGANVRLDLEKIHEYSIGRWDEMLLSQEMLTGPDGVYRFDTAKYPAMAHRPFMLMMSVTADGYADAKTWNWYSRRDASVSEEWGDVTLLAGRIVRGRVVSRDGDPIPGAVVKAASDYNSKNITRSQAWRPRKTDEDGNFTISVPRDSDAAIELCIVSREWAPQRVSVPKQGDVLADVRLQNGARVSGTVTREDGTPVAGTVVVAESIDDGTLEKYSLPIQVAVTTDAQGRYELPPLSGMFKIYLSQAAETDDRLVGRFVVGDRAPPLVSPVKIAVSGHQEQQIDFHAGPTLTVRGTVRWADGKPVADCQVQASFLPPDFGTGISLDDTRTDAEGNYTVELPKPIDAISIFVTGAFDAKREWHFAEAAEGVKAEQKSLQFIGLGRLTEDREGVDWVLKPREEVDGLQPVTPKPKDAAVLELEKLERRYVARQQDCQEALEAAKTLEDRHTIFMSLDPRFVMADEYLAFEARHKGTDAGLAALAKVERFAASVSDREPKLPEARREMYRRLTAHYLPHPGLDTVFASVSAGPKTELGAEMLRKAATESPHRHVQAAAIYWLARYLQGEADSVAQLNTMLAELENQSPRGGPYIDMLKAQLAERGKFDPAELNRDAVELARRLEREFADVQEPARVFEESGIFLQATKDQLSGMEPKPPYGQLAKGLLFDLEHLQLGLPAPPIDGSDRDGKRIEVNDYTGKVTVLAFVAFGHEPIETQLADLTKLPGGERLQTVVIRWDSGLVPVKNPGEPPPVKFIDEDRNGPVATRWAVNTWPMIFVVDGNGIIRARRFPQIPTNLVNDLLRSAAAETDRVFVPRSETTR